jgi:hypothetical protein
MSVAEAGVYWPFKSLLTGTGITIVETPTSITIGSTGAGPGGGDMLSSVYATNGAPGVVDKAVVAESCTGTVATAQLANSVPWGGIIGAPTTFPSDWGSITNKPALFPPIPHAIQHITGGNDIIPVASKTATGLEIILSGNLTDFKGGDGAWHNLNATIGGSPLTLTAAFACNGTAAFAAGVTVSAGGLTVSAGGLNVTGGATIAGNSLLVSAPLSWCGIINSATNPGFAFSNGADVLHNSCVLYKPAAANTSLWEAYYNAAGTQVYSAEVMNTYNQSGAYSMRATTRIIGTNDLPGNSTAWSLAPFLAQSNSNGGFAGYGMVCQNYWGCALGAWQSGLFMATSGNTFIQLTDNTGHILGSALQAGAAVANIGYTPANRAGDTFTGDVWVQKSLAQVIAYQDANNYTRMVGSYGLYVSGDFNKQGGHIVLQVAPGASSTVAGMTFKTPSYSYQLYGEDNGYVYLVRNNDGYVKQLLP